MGVLADECGFARVSFELRDGRRLIVPVPDIEAMCPLARDYFKRREVGRDQSAGFVKTFRRRVT